MSGNLFSVKILAIFTELAKTPAFEAMRHGPKVNAPDDDLIRLCMTSPEIQKEVAAYTKEKLFRIRVAVPQEIDDLVKISSLAQLETYNINGNQMIAPIKLTDLNNQLANALQVELLHTLLKTHGSRIPLL